jgi:hypothetical protein
MLLMVLFLKFCYIVSFFCQKIINQLVSMNVIANCYIVYIYTTKRYIFSIDKYAVFLKKKFFFG